MLHNSYKLENNGRLGGPYRPNAVLYNIVQVEDGEAYGVVSTIFLEASRNGDNDHTLCNQGRECVVAETKRLAIERHF